MSQEQKQEERRRQSPVGAPGSHHVTAGICSAEAAGTNGGGNGVGQRADLDS